MASVTGSSDSYLGLERHLKARVERGQVMLLGPPVALLQRLGFSPHAVSALQIPIALALFYALPRRPHWALLLFFAALILDSMDGMLARATGRSSLFGALWDQTCDHIQEILVVASLAHYGLVPPLWAALYALAYPGFNLLLLLCNRYRVPLALALKSYLVFYPALIVYLSCGVNHLTPALALATLAMAAGSGIALWRLHAVME